MDASMSKFYSDYVEPAEGRALIVGSALKPGRQDRRKLYREATGLDMEPGKGVDLVHNLETPLPEELRGTFSHAECTSVLEHSRKPWKLAENLEDALVVGGTLFFSAPFVWRRHGYPSDYFRFTTDGIRELFPRISWKPLLYIGVRVSKNAKIALQGFRVHGHPFLGRCEVYGFGVRI